MKIAALLLVITFPASAHAQYKCDGPGGVSFQQTPCPAGAAATRVGPEPTKPAEKPWIDPSRPEHVRKAFAEGRAVPGMTFAELTAMTGGRAPAKRNTLTTATGTRDQLVYRMPRRTVLVYLEADVVTAVQVLDK